MHHGGSLRYFNLSRELIALGHQVYFTSNRRPEDDPVEKNRFLRQLIDERTISGHFETDYQIPRSRGRVAQLAVSPGMVSRVLRPFQEPPTRQVLEYVGAQQIDACIFSYRRMLFLVPELARQLPAVIDWIDSYVLFWLRQIGMYTARGELSRLPYATRRLTEELVQERYYGRRSHMNMAVSPVDKRWLDIVNRRPERNRVLLNGVRPPAPRPSVTPVEDRLVFSGNMSFPPNYEGAIWFIDNVLPLLRERGHQNITFVVAGANPVPELCRREQPGVEIAGFVEDLEGEIARGRVYVAPLISGGGFKNKIVEALAAGQYVIATSRAVEFLDPHIREGLLIGDTPDALAAHILTYLENPVAFAERRDALQRIITTQFSWARRAVELLDVVSAAFRHSSAFGAGTK
jgi:glycosyltransferase involved in cell wall biosynthesis